MLNWFFIFVIILALVFFFWFWRRDRHYLKKPVREVLGEEVKKEIEEEHAGFNRRQKMFEEKLAHSRTKFKKDNKV